MAADWPFFRTLVQNMEMIMAKADMTIARRYASLVPDPALAAQVFGALQAEWDRTHAAVLAAQQRRLARDGQHGGVGAVPLGLGRAEDLGGDDDPRVREGILLSINGVAAGLRNSG